MKIKPNFIILLLLFGSLNIFAQKESKTVESVDIVGNRLYTDLEIFQFLKVRPLQTFDQKSVSVEEDVKQLKSKD